MLRAHYSEHTARETAHSRPDDGVPVPNAGLPPLATPADTPVAESEGEVAPGPSRGPSPLRRIWAWAAGADGAEEELAPPSPPPSPSPPLAGPLPSAPPSPPSPPLSPPPWSPPPSRALDVCLLALAPLVRWKCPSPPLAQDCCSSLTPSPPLHLPHPSTPHPSSLCPAWNPAGGRRPPLPRHFLDTSYSS